MFSLKHRILAIVFTILCLFSSAKLVLNQHFCCDRLVAVSVNSSLNKSCCKDSRVAHSTLAFSAESCCDETTVVLNNQDFISSSETELPNLKQYHLSNWNFHTELVNSNLFHLPHPYPLPILVRSVQDEFCVFRI